VDRSPSMERQRGDVSPRDAAPVPKRARNGPSGNRSRSWTGTFNDRVVGRGDLRRPGREVPGEEEEEEAGPPGAPEDPDAVPGVGVRAPPADVGRAERLDGTTLSLCRSLLSSSLHFGSQVSKCVYVMCKSSYSFFCWFCRSPSKALL